MKKILYLLLLVSISSIAQQINYTKRLRFTNEAGEKLSVKDVRSNIQDQILLDKFNSQVITRDIGNGFIISGPIFILIDMFNVMYGPGIIFPNTLSYLGVGASLVGILIKSGYQRRIKEVIDIHNSSQKNTSSLETNIIINANGVGVSFSF
ncbi:MAG: hypothetical protein ACOVQ2_03365 [Flavobacterium sp.]|jgi:hypothetical protein